MRSRYCSWGLMRDLFGLFATTPEMELDPRQPRGALQLCPTCGERVAVVWQDCCSVCAGLRSDPPQLLVTESTAVAPRSGAASETGMMPVLEEEPRPVVHQEPPRRRSLKGQTEVLPAVPLSQNTRAHLNAQTSRVLRFQPPGESSPREWKLLWTASEGQRYAVRLMWDAEAGWVLCDTERKPRDADLAAALAAEGLLVDREPSR